MTFMVAIMSDELYELHSINKKNKQYCVLAHSTNYRLLNQNDKIQSLANSINFNKLKNRSEILISFRIYISKRF